MTTHTNTGEVLGWLCRDYNSLRFWQETASVYFAATIEHPDGDADRKLAKQCFSQFLRHIWTHFQPTTVAVQRWDRPEFTKIETVQIEAPDCDADTVDWDHIADYFLSAITVNHKVVEKVNTARTEFKEKRKTRNDANTERFQTHLNQILEKLPIDIKEKQAMLARAEKDTYFDVSGLLQKHLNEPLRKTIEEIRAEDNDTDKLVFPKITGYNPPMGERTLPSDVSQTKEFRELVEDGR